MSSPEQYIPNAFLDFFKEKKDLFEPLGEIPDTRIDTSITNSSEYEPINDNERRLLELIKHHKYLATQRVSANQFNFIQAVGSNDLLLTVYREILGRSLGKPLEGGVRIGVDTGIKLENEFDENYNVFVVINSDGKQERMVTHLGCIYIGLLEDRDKSFLEEHYFPVSKLQQIIQPHLKRK